MKNSERLSVGAKANEIGAANAVLVKETERIYNASLPLLKNISGYNLLLTGATGFIGAHIVRVVDYHNSLVNDAEKISLQVVVRNPEKFQNMFPKTGAQVVNLTDAVTPDFLIDLVAPTDSKFMVTNPVETIDSIVGGASRLLEFLRTDCTINSLNQMGGHAGRPLRTVRDQGVRAVFLSSNEAYGWNQTDQPLAEADFGYLDTMQARSSYPQAKRLMETLVKAYAEEYQVNASVVRLGVATGVGIAKDDQRSYAQFIKAAAEDRDIKLLTEGSSKIALISPLDTLTGIFTVLIRGVAGELYNVTNPDNYSSVLEMAKLIKQELNPKIQVLVNQAGDVSKFAKERKVNMDIAKVSQLGWRSVDDLRTIFRGLFDYLSE